MSQNIIHRFAKLNYPGLVVIGVLYQIAKLVQTVRRHPTLDFQAIYNNLGYINSHVSVMSYHQKPYNHRHILNNFGGTQVSKTACCRSRYKYMYLHFMWL